VITDEAEAYTVSEPKTFTGVFKAFGPGSLGDSAMLVDDVVDGDGKPFRSHAWVQDAPFVTERLSEGNVVRFEARTYNYISAGKEKPGLLYAGGLSWEDGTPIGVKPRTRPLQHGVQLLERRLARKEARLEERLTCDQCGGTWTRTRIRGRKPSKCPSCQGGDRPKRPPKPRPTPTPDSGRVAALGKAIAAVADYPDLVDVLTDLLIKAQEDG
jgi:hypothetical protein